MTMVSVALLFPLFLLVVNGFLRHTFVARGKEGLLSSGAIIRPRTPFSRLAAYLADEVIPAKTGPALLNKDKSEKSIVLIAGFEAFNIVLYRQVADAVTQSMGGRVRVVVFTDADIEENAEVVERELLNADVLFTSLLFDYTQINWLRGKIQHIPTVFSFESALELMSETKVGDFRMKSGASGAMSGPPAPVKAILSKFGSSKEEDKMTGYLKFLKIGPSLLKLIPSDKFKDLKTWLTVYSYWNEGGFENVQSMLNLIIKDLDLIPRSLDPSKPSSAITVVNKVKETPLTAFFHPDLSDFISSPREYVRWYESTHSWVNEKTARVGILLYRKHVITKQSYIPNLIKLMESEGIMPIPVFINGVEAHTVVRDQFTTAFEQRNIIQSARFCISIKCAVIYTCNHFCISALWIWHTWTLLSTPLASLLLEAQVKRQNFIHINIPDKISSSWVYGGRSTDRCRAGNTYGQECPLRRVGSASNSR